MGKDKEKEETSFFSSSFATTTAAEEWGDNPVAWPTDIAPADDVEAPNTTINLGVRRCEQFTHMDEDDEEKEKAFFSSPSFDTMYNHRNKRGVETAADVEQEWTGNDTITLQRTPPPRRRGLGRHARWCGPGVGGVGSDNGR